MLLRKITQHLFIVFLFLPYLFFSCEGVNQRAESIQKEFLHDNTLREYLYFSPDSLPNKAPLLVVLHGFTSNAETIRDYTKFNDLAEKYKFAVVYPQGTMDKDSNTFWNVGYAFHKDNSVNDINYIVQLIKYLQTIYSLSEKNIFLTGMSNGAEMCYLLACTQPQLFTAVAPVAGMMLDSFFDNCNSDYTPPMLSVFGTNDGVTNFEGDSDNKDGWGSYNSIPSVIKFWTEKINYNSLQIDTLPDSFIADSSFIIREKYINTQNNKVHYFYKVINGGHDWPGAWGNKDIIISEEIWHFFNTHMN